MLAKVLQLTEPQVNKEELIAQVRGRTAGL